MRLSIVILTLCVAHSVHGHGIFNSLINTPTNVVKGARHVLGGIFGTKFTDLCAQDIYEHYKKAVTDFNRKLYTNVAARSDNHFVFSPYTIWLSLSALAEGSDASVRSRIFESLNLPEQSCLRRKFYEIALRVEEPGWDVSFDRRRSLILDEGLKVNPSWAKMMYSTGLLNIAYAPIKSYPQVTSKWIQQILRIPKNIVLRGNSVLLDSLDYQGLWTTAFDDAYVQEQPFYNDLEQKIGTVEMMRMKKRVRFSHVPFMSAEVLELPVGVNGRYTMLIAVGTGGNIIKNAISIFMGSILEIFSLLQMSLVPLDIAIPKFAISSVSNMRSALEDFGIYAFWTDPAATRYVSNPPASPGGLIQHVSIKIDSRGVEPPPSSRNGLASGLENLTSKTASGAATAVGHQFTADRPFMFAFFDTQTNTCLYAGAFSKPNGP